MKISKYPIISGQGNKYYVTIKKKEINDLFGDYLICKVYVKFLFLKIKMYTYEKACCNVQSLEALTRETVNDYETLKNKNNLVHSTEEKFKQWNGDMRE